MRLSLHNLGFAIVLASAGSLAGCGRSQPDPQTTDSAQFRGEPINPPRPPQSPNVAAAPPDPVAVAVVAPEGKPVPPAIAPPAQSEYQTVGFNQLASYNFDVPEGPLTNATAADKAEEQIPAVVKSLDQKKVSVKGFMLPLKVDAGVVTEFLIMKDQSMCCYGNVPKITEWISVKTVGKGIKPIMDTPVSIEGTLHVGVMRENGYLVGIYQMDGEHLIGGGGD
jgi:hypothetical protein